MRSEEHTSELQSPVHIVSRLPPEKKKELRARASRWSPHGAVCTVSPQRPPLGRRRPRPRTPPAPSRPCPSVLATAPRVRSAPSSFVYWSCGRRALRSFPTRRSSDLTAVLAEVTAGVFTKIPGVRFPDRIDRPVD